MKGMFGIFNFLLFFGQVNGDTASVCIFGCNSEPVLDPALPALLLTRN